MIIILVIIFIAFIASLVFANKALVNVKNYTGWEDDDYLSDAVKYLTWTVTVAWITLGLILIGGAFLIFYSFEKVTSALHWIVGGLLFLTIVSAIIVAIVASIAAKKIGDSGLKDSNADVEQGYKDCIYAAVISFVAIFLLILSGIIYYAYRYQKKKTEKMKTALAVSAQNQAQAQPTAMSGAANPVASNVVAAPANPVSPTPTVAKVETVSPTPIIITA